MNRRIRPFLFLFAVILTGFHCGYFEDLAVGVEKTPAVLTGLLLDSLSGNGVTGAAVTVNDITVYSDARGYFQMTGLYTGNTAITIQSPDYPCCTRAIALTKEPIALGNILLVRNNHAPTVRRIIFPLSGMQSAPLLLQIRCMVGDSDLTFANSQEQVRYDLYLGASSTPSLYESGLLDTFGLKGDSVALVAPDSLLRNLVPDTWYYWRLVLNDMLGGSSETLLDSFRTRGAVTACSSGMVLVEKEAASFCMDKYEFTNALYESLFDPSHIDKRSSFSSYNQSPWTNVMDSVADSICRKRGRRLCTISEWKAAVGGYREWAYPYGNTYDPGKCRTSTEDLFKGTDTVGANKNCVSVYGVYDLSGNAAEWVRYDEETLYLVDARKPAIHYYYYAGGTWMSGENSGVSSVENTQALSRDFIGFRCCYKVQRP